MATDANGNVTSVTYQGNQDLAPTEIAQGVTLTAQVVGANPGASGPTASSPTAPPAPTFLTTSSPCAMTCSPPTPPLSPAPTGPN